MEDPSTDLPNLCSPQLGTKVVFATDEWFAECGNMLKDNEALFDDNTFTSFGKEMDGWECQRRRTEGHDWCIIKLGKPGIIDAIELDTLWFTGNFSPMASVYGMYYEDGAEPHVVSELLQERAQSKSERGGKDGAFNEEGRMGTKASDHNLASISELQSEEWNPLVPLQPLGAGYKETSRTLFKVEHKGTISHLRVNMGPDGGIARIRAYGRVNVSSQHIQSLLSKPNGDKIDLAHVENGGIALGCSNKHYGHPRNLVNPGRGLVMGDGWETARQPKRPPIYERDPKSGLMLLPGFDWAALQLGLPGYINALDVDTNHYKGNYPESCLVEACNQPNYVHDGNSGINLAQDENDSEAGWVTLLDRTRLGPHHIHSFSSTDLQGVHDPKGAGPFTHVKITIYPDGGVQRLRVYGTPSQPNSRL